jgi:glutamyl-tRNA reductase
LRDSEPSAAETSPLNRIVVLAATHRDSNVGQRAGLADLLGPWRSHLDEAVLLDTCHRVELIGVRGNGLGDPPRGARQVRGRAAVERIFEVVAGFDSAVVAEEQLLGQVRDALAASRAAGSVGPMLDELMRRAIRFGRRVRSHATPQADRSLADRAARWTLERLSGREGGRAVVFGTGEIARLLARRLVEAGLDVTIASKQRDRATAAAADTGAIAGTVSSEVSVADVDIVAIATRAASPFLDLAALAAGPLVVDLSTPGAVTPDAVAALGERWIGIDALADVRGGETLAPAVERQLRRELAAEVERYVAWLEAQVAERGIGMLRRHAEAVRQRHVARLRRNATLDDEQLAAVEAATAGIVAEILHVPTVQLRGDPDAERRVRELFGVPS